MDLEDGSLDHPFKLSFSYLPLFSRLFSFSHSRHSKYVDTTRDFSCSLNHLWKQNIGRGRRNEKCFFLERIVYVVYVRGRSVRNIRFLTILVSPINSEIDAFTHGKVKEFKKIVALRVEEKILDLEMIYKIIYKNGR